MPDGVPAIFTGMIDRIDRLPSGGIEVIDYKTGKLSSQKGVQESLQLSIYALACRDALGLGTPEKVTLYFTGVSDPDEHDADRRAARRRSRGARGMGYSRARGRLRGHPERERLLAMRLRADVSKKKECSQLWDDIVRAANAPTSNGAHFVGSIVYIESDLYQVGIVPRLLVIDGQQRLATLSLLIAALARTIKTNGDSGEMTHKKLANYYLLNGEETDDTRYKLILTQGDRATLTAIVDEHDLPDEPARRLARNFDFFAGRIAASGLSADRHLRGPDSIDDRRHCP